MRFAPPVGTKWSRAGGELRRYPLGRYLVRLREQVRVGPEHGLRGVSEPSGDVNRDAGRQRQGRGCMPEDVKGPGGDPGRFAVLAEPLSEPLRMYRAAKLVGKDEILVDIGVARQGALELLGIAMFT